MTGDVAAPDPESPVPGDYRWSKRKPSVTRCREIAAFLRTARSLVGDYLELDEDWRGRDSSLHQKQLDAISCDEAVLRGEPQAAVNNAGVLLFAAVQDLESIAELLEADHPPVYAITALARMAMELCAWSWWLTDPSIDARTRSARIALQRMHSAREVDRFVSSGEVARLEIGDPKSLEETAVDARKLHFGVRVGRRQIDDRVGGEQRPTITRLMESFAGRDIETRSDRSYRLMSAVTHGTLWGVMIFFYEGDLSDGRLSTEFSVSQGWIDGPSCAAALAYSWAVEHFVELLGWSPEPLRAWTEQVDALFGDFIVSESQQADGGAHGEGSTSSA